VTPEYYKYTQFFVSFSIFCSIIHARMNDMGIRTFRITDGFVEFVILLQRRAIRDYLTRCSDVIHSPTWRHTKNAFAVYSNRLIIAKILRNTSTRDRVWFRRDSVRFTTVEQPMRFVTRGTGNHRTRAYSRSRGEKRKTREIKRARGNSSSGARRRTIINQSIRPYENARWDPPITRRIFHRSTVA